MTPGDAVILAGPPADQAETDAALTERFRASILSGALRPGTKLPEELLADTLGLTRARVRAILQRLAFEELVALKRNRGAFVASPAPKEAADVFEARRVIERVTTEIVARTVLTHQIAPLHRRLDRQEAAWQQGDFQQAIRELGEFHLDLCALGRNTVLTGLLERLIRRTSLILALYAPPRGLMRVMAQHRALLAVIERGESLLAARLMERCLFNLERELDMRRARAATPDIRRVLAGLA